MTEEDRAGFNNLILLCRPHHILVDKTRPDDFPSELLEEWKRDREAQNAKTFDPKGKDGWDDLVEVITDALAANLRLDVPLEPATLPLKQNMTISPYQILWPRYGIVPFLDHAGTLADLESWCQDDAVVSAAFVDAVGGMGKTRTAVELARRLAESGWMTGFFRFDSTQAGLVLRQHKIHRLIIFDYANDRPNQINAFIEELVSVEENRTTETKKIRLLLITRNAAGASGKRAFTSHQNNASSILEDAQTFCISPTQDSDLASATRLTRFELNARRSIFDSACRAISSRLGIQSDVPVEPNLESDTFAVPLFVVLAAILAVHNGVLAADLTKSQILEKILNREAELFWNASPEPDRAMRERVVCVPTIAPALNERVVVDRLTTLGYAYQGVETNRIALWLRSLYEGPHWANGLEPDLLGEHLLASALQPVLAESIVQGGTANEASTVLRVLGRILSTSPGHEVNGAVKAVTSVLGVTVERWLSEEREGSNLAADGLESAAAFIEKLPTGEFLPPIQVPGRLGPAGAKLAVSASRKWLADAECKKISENVMYTLKANLADRLVKAQYHEEALKIAQQALSDPIADLLEDVDVVHTTLRLLSAESRCRSSTRQNGRPPLKRALALLSQLDQPARASIVGMDAAIQAQYVSFLRARESTEALAMLATVIDLRRKLVDSDGEVHIPALAASLRKRANLHFREENFNAAGLDITEAIDKLRHFIKSQVSLFENDLARCLDLAARILDAQNSQGWEASTHREEALQARKRLASAFGVDAQIELAQALVRSAYSDPDRLSYFRDAVSLATELDEMETLQLSHYQELAKLVKRLSRHPRAGADQVRLAEWSRTMLEVSVESCQASTEAVAFMLTFADNAAREGRVEDAFAWYEKALRTSSSIQITGSSQKITTAPALRLPSLINQLIVNAREPLSPTRVDRLVERSALMFEGSVTDGVDAHYSLRSHGFIAGWLEAVGSPDHPRALNSLEKVTNIYVTEGAMKLERAQRTVDRAKSSALTARVRLVTMQPRKYRPKRLTQRLRDFDALQRWQDQQPSEY